MKHHIVLLGDSVFDNGAYVPGKPSVIEQLKNKLPSGWKATLLAVDGSGAGDVKHQAKRLPDDTTFLAVSAGGNDALGHAYIFNERVSFASDVFLKLADIQSNFRTKYRDMLKAVQNYNLPTAICTIYNPRFPDPTTQKMAEVALSIFNDCIISEAFKVRVPLIDLRIICNRDKDFANPIEPSEHGGEKITDAILRVVKGVKSGKGKIGFV